MINIGVAVATLLKFPLVLFPAIEALRGPSSGSSTDVANHHPNLVKLAAAARTARTHDVRVRLLVVSLCILLAFTVSDVALTVAVFGCLCQSSLTAVPCLLRLRLFYVEWRDDGGAPGNNGRGGRMPKL